MENKEYERYRNVNLSFRVTEKERKIIEQKMKMAKMKNMRAFIIKMVAEGRIIHIELDSINQMTRLLSNISNNINQIARKVNITESIYKNDVELIRKHIDEIWGQVNEILHRLSAVYDM